MTTTTELQASLMAMFVLRICCAAARHRNTRPEPESKYGSYENCVRFNESMDLRGDGVFCSN